MALLDGYNNILSKKSNFNQSQYANMKYLLYLATKNIFWYKNFHQMNCTNFLLHFALIQSFFLKLAPCPCLFLEWTLYSKNHPTFNQLESSSNLKFKKATWTLILVLKKFCLSKVFTICLSKIDQSRSQKVSFF